MTRRLLALKLAVLFFIGCDSEEDKEQIFWHTHAVTEITQTTARSGGIVPHQFKEKFKEEIIEQGVYWATHNSPSLSDNFAIGTTGSDFTALMTGLTPNTPYYVRAYIKTKSRTFGFNLIYFETLE